MLETIKNAWRITELRKKILYTLFIVFIFLLTYSACVVAKDEDDAVQGEWIRNYLEKRQTGEPGKEEKDRT